MVDHLLGPGGRLALSLEGYEARDAQLSFARDVLATLEKGGVLLAEAPTGVGKSLGYLVPAILWSRLDRSPVIVSTHTKALQGQLTDVDLPMLADLFDPPPRVVRLKGKHNYVCPRRWRLFVAEHKRRGAKATRAEETVAEWFSATATGDLDELDLGAYAGGPALRSRIASEPTFCNANACRPGGECPWRRARRQAQSAEVVIVNHALLVSGLPAGTVLPPFRALIVDEAHHLDSVLTAQATVRQSQGRLETLLATVAGGERAGQGSVLATLTAATEGRLTPALRGELLTEIERLGVLVAPLRDAGHAFFGQVAASLTGKESTDGYDPRARFRMTEEIVLGAFDPLEHVFTLGQEAHDRFRNVLSLVSRAEGSQEMQELEGDVAGVFGQWQEWLGSLRFLTDPRDGEFVYWRGGARAENAEIAAAPVTIDRRVREQILPELNALVLTSATLTAGGSFRYLRERLGLTEDVAFEVTENVYPSPFDFPRQLAAWALDPAPAGGDDVLPDASAVGVVEALSRRLGRNTLVLFTSYRELRAAARRLRDRLGDDVPLWAQEVDGTAVELARRFRDARGSVLLGTASFWEGVDFPGEALEVLVVTRLPFSVPTDPLVEARCERIEAEGESGFARAMVPEAVLRFRQGIGRLVRRRTDRGVLAILDPRIVRRGYGVHFRRGLPVALRQAADASDLAEQAAAFLEDR
ncbi:MAG: ATP-dependent DNA helicase [Candidatus Eiseniibacteriota bacterium]